MPGNQRQRGSQPNQGANNASRDKGQQQANRQADKEPPRQSSGRSMPKQEHDVGSSDADGQDDVMNGGGSKPEREVF